MKKLLFALFLFLAFSSIPAWAQTKTGISVVPSIIQLDLATDAPQALITYTNNTPQAVTMSLSASDFTQLEDGYKLSFLSEKSAQNYRYRLSPWVDFSDKNITILPFSAASVTVFINEEALSPGGHYASILANIQSIQGQGNVQLHSVLSSLLFVRTHTGKEKESAQVSNFHMQQDWWNIPNTAVIRFNNTGETVITPYGLVTVTDAFGHQVEKGIVNEDSLFTLPETIRQYDIPLRQTKTFLFPGIYRATIAMHYGKQNLKIEATTTFFSAGSFPVLPIIGTLLLVIIGLLVWKRLLNHAHEMKQ